jgi:hypothetical protein
LDFREYKIYGKKKYCNKYFYTYIFYPSGCITLLSCDETRVALLLLISEEGENEESATSQRAGTSGAVV